MSSWGGTMEDLKSGYEAGKNGGVTGLGPLVGGSLSYFSKDYLKGIPRSIERVAWATPKAAVMSVVNPVRKDIYETVGLVGDSLQGFKIEVVKDLLKPFTYTAGHIMGAEGFWGKAGAFLTSPLAFIGGIGSTITHLPGDILSMAPSFVGGAARTIGNIGKGFFGALDTFGKGMLVTSDTIEEGVNHLLVPPKWRESHDNEYEFKTQWGNDFFVKN